MWNSWLAWLALIVLAAALILGLLAWLGLRLADEQDAERSRRRTGWASAGASSYETLLIVTTLSPFVTAFATSLGQRLGTGVKIRRRAWRRNRESNNLVLTYRDRTTTIEMSAGLSDEARLALIDLDVNRPELWGHRLRWNEEAAAWLPVPVTTGSDDGT
ncbi:hypothetical protein [Streptomyces sp. NPDC007172]|uniref:hypothetical protein n=1 Tax=Streptomyces sp. NPDC007172 TaxID=3364776 RepID=UPI003687F513